MKKLLIAIGVIVVLLIAAVVALPFLVPTETVIARVQERVLAQTGRELAVDGPVEISVLPDLAVRLENVALANAPGGAAETLASLAALEVSVELMPLLSGSVAIDRFRMVAPVINLEVAEDGTPNWRLGGPAGAEEDTPGPGGDSAEGAGGGLPSELSLGVVEIVDGRVTYADAATGRDIVVEDVEARLGLPSLDGPATLEAGFVYGGEAVVLNGRIEDPRALIAGGGSAAAVELESAPVMLAFDGRAAAGDSPSVTGAATLEVPSVPALAGWLPVALPESPVEAVSFDGGVDAAPDRLTLSDFTLTADGSTASGTLTVDTEGARPSVTGDLAVSALDLDALMADAGAAAAAAETGGAEAEPAESVTAPPAEAPVSGAIDLSMLDAATVDLTVDLGGLTVEGTEVGPTTLTVTLADRRLEVQVAEAAVFDGTVAGSAVVDAAGAVPRVDVSVAVREIALGPPLAAFAGMEDAAGVLTLDLQAAGAGETRQALADSLTGSATGSLAGGAFTVPDPQDGAPLRLEAVDLALDMPSFDGPLSAEGSASVSGEAVAFELTVGDPRALVAGGDSAVAVDLDAPRGRLAFDGTATGGPAPAVSGSLDTAVPSLTALAAWLPVDLPIAGLPVDSVSAQGTLAASPARVALSDATISADDLSASGTVAVEMAGARPSLYARLSTGYLDLDRFLGAAGGAGDGAGADGGADAGATGPTDAGGWSTETLDLSPLTAADIDAVVELREGMRAGGVEIGATTLTVMLQDGALDASAPSVPVFGGTVTADVGVSAGPTPSWRLALQADGVAIEPVLVQFAETDRLSGTTDATANITATGPSPAAIVSTLNGAGALLFRDGAIKGVNIAAMVRNVGSAFTASNTGDAQSTDFAELGGTFTLTEGLFRTDDLRMLAPLFRIEGSGTSSIPRRTLDFRLEPRLVATIEGQGGEFQETGVRVPVLVGGTWSDPTFRPDLAGLVERTLQDPEAARQQLEGLVEGLQGDGGIQPEDVLRGLLGGGEAAPAPAEAPAPADTTAEPAPVQEPAPESEPAPEPQPAPQDLEQQLQEDPIGTLRGLFGN